MARDRNPARTPARTTAQPRARIQFDLTSLRIFIATAELGGVTKAAERQALAPAAASRRIAELESQFGVALFERRPHGMAPTEAGRSLLAHARAMLHTVARMQDEAASYRHGDKGVVRIAAARSMVLQFLPADLQRCRIACPDVRVDLQEMNSQGVLQALARQQCDLGIFESGVGASLPWPTRPYRDDRLALLVPRDHPLARRKAGATLEQMIDCDMVGLEEGSAMVLTLERAAAAAGRVLRLRARVGSYDSMAAMVAQGVGIGVMPSTVAEQAARGGPLRRVPIREPWALRHFLLCSQPDENLGSAARSIADVLAPPVEASGA